MTVGLQELRRTWPLTGTRVDSEMPECLVMVMMVVMMMMMMMMMIDDGMIREHLLNAEVDFS